MFRPFTTLRRWLRCRSRYDAPPTLPAMPKYRPALTALEDRNAPGDILSGVLAAAISGALLNPMDQVAAWVGSPSGAPIMTAERPETISVVDPAREAAELQFRGPFELAGSDRSAILQVPTSSPVSLPPPRLTEGAFAFSWSPDANGTPTYRFLALSGFETGGARQLASASSEPAVGFVRPESRPDIQIVGGGSSSSRETAILASSGRVGVKSGSVTPNAVGGVDIVMSDLALLPVNANKDNGAAWAKDQPFIPSVRDFDATNLPVNDPQLIAGTVTVTGGLAGTLSYSQYEPGEAQVGYWKDQKKQTALGSEAIAAGKAPVSVAFFAEGRHESSASNDYAYIDWKFTPADPNKATVEKTYDVTVAPILTDYTAAIPNPSISFFFQGPPAPEGTSGLIAAGPPAIAGGALTPTKFTATVINGSLTMKYTQVMMSLTNGANGSGAGAVYVAGSKIPNRNLLPKANSGLTYPALDSTDANDPTAMAKFESVATEPNTVAISMYDSPNTGPPGSSAGGFGALLAETQQADKVDVKFSLRQYVVVQYADKSLYAIAYRDWSANEYATTNKQGIGVTVIPAAAKVVAADWSRGNENPAKTSGAIFNNNTEFQ